MGNCLTELRIVPGIWQECIRIVRWVSRIWDYACFPNLSLDTRGQTEVLQGAGGMACTQRGESIRTTTKLSYGYGAQWNSRQVQRLIICHQIYAGLTKLAKV